MDESERRRERLKAMRNEAAQGEIASSNQMDQVSGFRSGLANPLTDASPLQEVKRSAPRFDYYTDPMASFSANRKGHVDSQSHAPRGFVPNHGHLPGPPVRQMLPQIEPWNPMVAMNPFPGPRAYQGGGHPFNNPVPYRTPIVSENPYVPNHEFPPGVGNQLSSRPSYNPQPNFPRGGNFLNPERQSGSRNFSLGQGRGQPFQGSYSGRGRGNWGNNKIRMESEHDSNRTLGSANPTPKSLYEKFMVDDPWKSLKPSIWHEEKSDASLPSSKIVGVKRHLENSGPSASSSQSLAEYLADSFNEAVKGDPDP